MVTWRFYNDWYRCKSHTYNTYHCSIYMHAMCTCSTQHKLYEHCVPLPAGLWKWNSTTQSTCEKYACVLRLTKQASYPGSVSPAGLANLQAGEPARGPCRQGIAMAAKQRTACKQAATQDWPGSYEARIDSYTSYICVSKQCANTHCAVLYGAWSSSLPNDGSVHGQDVSHLHSTRGYTTCSKPLPLPGANSFMSGMALHHHGHVQALSRTISNKE